MIVDRPGDELRALLAAIVDSSDDAIVSKTLDGIITSWNRGAEELFGYTADEAIGRSIFLIIPEDRIAEEHDVLARLGRGEKVDHFETVRRAKDGRAVPISLTVSPIRNAQGQIVGASKVARDISERELARANEALRVEMLERQRAEQHRIELLSRVVIAEEEERRRIARELHDQLGQHLTALRLTLEMLKSGGGVESRNQVETLEQLALQLDRDIAFRVCELRSPKVETLGLRAALTDHVQNWSKHFGIPVHLHMERLTAERWTSELETMMYRLAQEALNNVAKHARADRVDIVLEHHADHLSLIVEDNGKGFTTGREDSGQHFGLISMRERAALLGAELQIESAPGRGTTVVVRVPIPAAVNKT